MLNKKEEIGSFAYIGLDKTYIKLFRRCYFMLIITFIVLAISAHGIMEIVARLSEMQSDKKDLILLICLVSSVASVVIWFSIVTKAIYDLIKIYYGIGYPTLTGDDGFWEPRTEYVKISFFTGQEKIVHIRSSNVFIQTILLYPITRILLNRNFRKTVEEDEKLQKKYITENEYHKARKIEVKKALKDIKIDVVGFEIITWMFLFLENYIIYHLLVIMGF